MNMSLLDAQNSPGSDAPPPKKKTFAEGVLPYTSVMLVLALLYVAWTFYSRHERAQASQEAIEKKQQDQEQKEANLIFGSGEVKFLTFSASSGHLKRGDTAKLCYGVVNATTLKIEPAVGEEVKPTSRHCVDISPKATTTYTITGVNAKGESKSASLTVNVN